MEEQETTEINELLVSLFSDKQRGFYGDLIRWGVETVRDGITLEDGYHSITSLWLQDNRFVINNQGTEIIVEDKVTRNTSTMKLTKPGAE